MRPKLAQETSAARNIATRENMQAVRDDMHKLKYDILKWMFGQTLVLLAGWLFGLVALVAHLLGK